MSTVETAIGRIGWHELLTKDVEKAKSFYTELFGWGVESFKPGEVDYEMISADGKTHGGFLSVDEIAPGAPTHWIAYVVVDDADEVSSAAEANGGRTVFGPTVIPDVGRIVVIADPKGAVIAAIGPFGEAPRPEGVFVWDELLTTDVEEAKRFYGAVFGWTTSEMDVGGGAGPYTLFQAGEAQVAGAMTKPGEAPPMWMTYIGTDDVDVTTEKARGLGATVYVEPMDIPTIGRFSVIADPTGASVGLFQPHSS
jgi:predicted enzyme related to lactoylglutathione lyase